MSDQSKAYAEALFALAAETGEEKACLEGLELVSETLAETPAYRELLASPAIPREERDGALEQAFAAHTPVQVLSFVGLLCAHGLVRQFDDCVAEYRRLYEASIALTTARVVSAVPLTEAQQDTLRAKLEKMSGHTVRLVCTVDESLLGGVTVQLDGKVLDGSLRHRLHEVKEVMEQ